MNTTTEPASLSLDSIADLQSWYIAQGRSENTVKAYSTDLRMFVEWLLRQPEHSTQTNPCRFSLELTLLERYAQRWLNETRRTASPKTTIRRLASLRAFAKFSGISQLLENYKPPEALRPMPHPIPEGISGVMKMLEICRTQEERALVALTGLAGLRISEALSTGVSNFDFDEMLLHVHGKGDKPRVVPMAAQLVINCAPRISQVQSGLLISFSDSGARRAITRLARKAGLRRHVASHDMRATFATAAFDASLNIRAVQELLGHASSQTTEIYTQVKQNTLREIVSLVGNDE